MDIKSLLGDKWKDDLTVAEIIELLDRVEPQKEIITDNTEVEKWKAQFNKASSDLADTKKQLTARLSEDEKKEAEREQREQEMQAQLEVLRRDKALTETKAKYISLGFDDDLADKTASAFADGDTETVFANLKLHQENVVKKAQETALDKTPKPQAGSGGSGEITKEQFDKMGYSEMVKLQADNPILYEKLTKGE